MALLFGGAEPFVQFSGGHYEEHFCEIILNLDQEDMSFKNMFIYSSGCLAERNHLCNFGRGHYGEHFCELKTQQLKL